MTRKTNTAEVVADTKAVTSAKLAKWEDGTLAFFLGWLGQRLNKDGGNTPEATLVSKAPALLLRVGALMAKTKTGIATVGSTPEDGVVSEPFEMVPADEQPSRIMYLTLNYRNNAKDMACAALAAILTGIAWQVTRNEVLGDAKLLPKAKRYGSKVHAEVLASLGISRDPIKDTADKTVGYRWNIPPKSPGADAISECIAKVGEFPAAALAFFRPVGEPSAVCKVFFSLEAESLGFNVSGGPATVTKIVNALNAHDLKVTRIQFAPRVVNGGVLVDGGAAVLAATYPDLVYLGKAETPYDPTGKTDEDEHEDTAPVAAAATH